MVDVESGVVLALSLWDPDGAGLAPPDGLGVVVVGVVVVVVVAG